MKFGKLTLRKIIKILATRCLILELKYTKSRFRLGLRPEPQWGSLQRSPRSRSCIWGPTSKGKGRGGKGREGRRGEERGEEGKKGKEGEKGKWRTAAIPNFLGPE